jgi:hypothetical protein
MHDQLLLVAAILARWQHPEASSEALDLLYWAMRAALYRRIAMTIKTASKLVYVFIVVLFDVALATAGAIQSK